MIVLGVRATWYFCVVRLGGILSFGPAGLIGFRGKLVWWDCFRLSCAFVRFYLARKSLHVLLLTLCVRSQWLWLVDIVNKPSADIDPYSILPYFEVPVHFYKSFMDIGDSHASCVNNEVPASLFENLENPFRESLTTLVTTSFRVGYFLRGGYD